MCTSTLKALAFCLLAFSTAAADKTVTQWKTSTTTQYLTKTASASCAAASPYQSFTVNYNFDTVQAVDGTSLTEIQEYNLLYFTMNLVDILPQAVGIIPHTANNVAVFDAAIQAQDGTAMITANYQESTIDHFTARSLYYSCTVASEETAESVPVACNISATGYDRNMNAVASQTFVFVPVMPLSNMIFGNFSAAFKNLWHVDFSVTNNATTAAQIDDFIADIYQLPTAPLS